LTHLADVRRFTVASGGWDGTRDFVVCADEQLLAIAEHD